MKVLMSDTSVFADLERGDLLNSCFRLPLQFAVADLLYKQELTKHGGPELLARGLSIEELTGVELAVAQEARGANAKLSLADAYTYALAASRLWTLLGGDGELRAVARARRIPIYGVLWILDGLCDGGVVKVACVIDGLQTMAAHPGCRLARAEVQFRLEKYRRRLPKSA